MVDVHGLASPGFEAVQDLFGNGFALNSEATPISPNPRALFWAGWGGSFAVIDLDPRVSVAYARSFGLTPA